MTTTRARRCAALLAVAVLGACGVPADDSPQAIPRSDLPADLLDPNPGSSTTLDQSGSTRVTVFLLGETRDGVRLMEVDRRVNDPDVPNERLAALFSGVTETEVEDGLRTGIPADTVLLDVSTDDDADEVIVNLSEDLFTVEGEALAQAFAQIVWTATEPGGYRQVRFQVDGEPTPVLDGDGTEHEGAVTRSDYDALAPTLD